MKLRKRLSSANVIRTECLSAFVILTAAMSTGAEQNLMERERELRQGCQQSLFSHGAISGDADRPLTYFAAAYLTGMRWPRRQQNFNWRG